MFTGSQVHRVECRVRREAHQPLTIRTGSLGYFDTVGAPKGLPVAVLVAVLVSTFTSRHNLADPLSSDITCT